VGGPRIYILFQVKTSKHIPEGDTRVSFKKEKRKYLRSWFHPQIRNDKIQMTVRPQMDCPAFKTSKYQGNLLKGTILIVIDINLFYHLELKTFIF